MNWYLLIQKNACAIKIFANFLDIPADSCFECVCILGKYKADSNFDVFINCYKIKDKCGYKIFDKKKLDKFLNMKLLFWKVFYDNISSCGLKGQSLE